MGIMDKLRGNPETQTRSEEQYVDLSNKDVNVAAGAGDTQIHFAEINGQQDTINVKDALYDGDIVVVDLKYAASAGMNVEHVQEQLSVTVEEVGGDIVQRGEDTLIVTPNGVSVSREKL